MQLVADVFQINFIQVGYDLGYRSLFELVSVIPPHPVRKSSQEQMDQNKITMHYINNATTDHANITVTPLRGEDYHLSDCAFNPADNTMLSCNYAITEFEYTHDENCLMLIGAVFSVLILCFCAG
jgi:hypothetical protein